MTPMRRKLAGLIMLLSVAALLWMVPGQARIVVTDARAVAVEGQPDALRIFATVQAGDGPDRLLSVRSADAASADLVTQGDAQALTIPAGAAPALAADGAHLLLTGVADARPGDLLPLTFEFDRAGKVAVRARVSGDALVAGPGAFGLGDICRVGPGEPAPQVALALANTPDGWQVSVTARDFTFAEPLPALGHIPGQGHGHLYLDGLKLQRLYEPTARIGTLPPGRYEVSVTLNTNDHRAYVVEDVAVTASAVLEVP